MQLELNVLEGCFKGTGGKGKFGLWMSPHLYVRVSPLISPLVGLSIGGSVEWLISWSVMLLLRTRGDKLLIVGIPVL